MKQKTAVIAGIAALMCLGGAGVAWQRGVFDTLNYKSHGAISACEATIREQLVSPSSYRRVWADYMPRPALTAAEYKELKSPSDADQSVSQWLINDYIDELDQNIERKTKAGQRLTDEEQRMFDGTRLMDAKAKRNAPEDRTGFVVLEYDSDNRFGATLRSFSTCRFGAIGANRRFDQRDLLMSGPIDLKEGRSFKKLADLEN